VERGSTPSGHSGEIAFTYAPAADSALVSGGQSEVQAVIQQFPYTPWYSLWFLRPSQQRFKILLPVLHLVLSLCLVAWFISSVTISICADCKSEQYFILLDWFILLGMGGYYVPPSNTIVMEDFISHICCLYSSAEESNSRVQQVLIILVMRQVVHISFKARKSLQLSVHLQYCSARRIWKLKKP